MEYATKEKVDAGFRAASERIENVEMTLDEAKQCIGDLQAKSRRLLTLSLSGPDGGGVERGFFGNEELAREFGECVLKAIGRKDLGVGVPSAGGVLVPDEVARRFVDMLGRYGRFRANATVLPINSASALVPRLVSDMAINCPGEGKPIPPSAPTFDQIRLTPRTWTALTVVSKELDDDSVIAVGQILGISLARSFARVEDRVGFLGDGTEQYFGMTGVIGKLLSIDPDPAQVAGIYIGTGTGWGGLVLDDFEAVDALLPEDAEDEAKWFVSKAFYNRVMRKLATDTAASAMFDLLSEKRGRYFLGYPVVPVSCLPRVSGNGQICAILGNLQLGAYLAERRQLTIERSDERYFESYSVGVRGVERIDISAFGCGDKTNPGSIVALMTGSPQ